MPLSASIAVSRCSWSTGRSRCSSTCQSVIAANGSPSNGKLANSTAATLTPNRSLAARANPGGGLDALSVKAPLSRLHQERARCRADVEQAPTRCPWCDVVKPHSRSAPETVELVQVFVPVRLLIGATEVRLVDLALRPVDAKYESAVRAFDKGLGLKEAAGSDPISAADHACFHPLQLESPCTSRPGAQLARVAQLARWQSRCSPGSPTQPREPRY